MPGSVVNASPTAVLPQTLSRSFTRVRQWRINQNDYRNGENQRALLVLSSRKTFRLMKRITPAQMAVLRDFYIARNGSQEPFFFDDPWETVPQFTPTPDGSAGRYKVRFEGSFEQTMGIGLGEAALSLIEVA